MTLDALIKLLDKVIPPQQAAPSDCIETVSGSVTFFLDEEDGSSKNTGTSFASTIPAGADPNLYFQVNNPATTEYAVWKYDGCFFPLRGPARCDIILFSDVKIAFVELKLNATSLKNRAIKENRKKAISQLETSIQRLKGEFASSSVPWPFSETLANIAAPQHYPHFASKNAHAVKRFADDFNATLQEANPITFP